MDGLHPPDDPELKNIIDKLANFVARNGSDFENMTKEKQRNNPKFSFLFGGPTMAYYKMKLAMAYKNMAEQDTSHFPPWEQKSNQSYNQFQQATQNIQMTASPMNVDSIPPWQRGSMQQQMFPQNPPPNETSKPSLSIPPQPNFNRSQQTPTREFSQTDAPEPIKSEIEQKEIDLKKLKEETTAQITQSESNLNQQYEVLMLRQQENIEKEIEKAQISKLKQLSNGTDIALIEFDAKLAPIIKNCTKDSISNGKAYILNHSTSEDHCDVMTGYILQRVMEIDKEGGGKKSPEKFEKQLHIIYLINDVLHHASRKNIADIVHALAKQIVPIFCTASLGLQETDPQKERLEKLIGLWGKFGYFNDETIVELKDPATSLAAYQASLVAKHSEIVKQAQKDIETQYDQFMHQHKQYVEHVMTQLEDKKLELKCLKDNEMKNQQQQWQSHIQKFDYEHGQPQRSQQLATQSVNYPPPPQQWDQPPRPPMPEWPRHAGPPPPWQMRPVRPPMPMLPPPPQAEIAFIPTAPYYELPAGLSCPLVKLEDFDYKPLDPAMIRLPPPIPPSDRLLAALDAFYAPPSHDRPRNLDGWEKMGLYEFHRAKVQARRDLENKGKRSSDNHYRRRQGRSRSRNRSYSRSYSRSRSRSYSRSYSRSRSRSSSGSRSRSRSKTPDKKRSVSKSPPPGFLTLPAVDKLGDNNKGAQMMKKMGWEGAGLGFAEQGRQEPVKEGEVREKMDQFKGLGMPASDPFENFRKSKSQGFIARIKSRIDDL